MLVGSAIAGAVLSVAGGMIFPGIAQTLWSLDAETAAPIAFLPIVTCHAGFLILASRAAVHTTERFRARHGLGIFLLVVIIATTCLGAAQLPEPLPFLVPIALASVLSWTPLIPAVAVGPTQWSLARFITAVLASLPFLALAEIFGFIPQAISTAGEGFGLMEGGMITWPLLGLHMWLATVTAALVPTIVYLAPRPTPDTVFA